MKIKNVIIILLLALAAYVLDGCGKSPTEAAPEATIGYYDDIYAVTDTPSNSGAAIITPDGEGVDRFGQSPSAPAVAPDEFLFTSPDEAGSYWMEGDGDWQWNHGRSNNEEYKPLTENGFLSVARAPLSTFAADVDTASYANLRRLLRSGYGIGDLPDGAVRIEEMLNYFSYDFAKPRRGEPFGVTMEISACPWNPDTELLLIGLKTEEIDFSEGPPSHLVFLIDVSGSMDQSDKLPLLKESFTMLTENLTSKDRVSIVTYAGSERSVLEGVRGDQTKTIIEAINGLRAGGSTNGGAGIIRAYELAAEYFIEGGNNRIILATDGDLNVGLTTDRELEELVTKKREGGVFLSVLGFGTGNIKDNKMQTLANKGNGNYAYIDSGREGRKVLVEEMGATLLTVAKDVKLQVEFNPLVVSEYRLIGYEKRLMDWQDFRDDAKDAGEIGAGHSVTVLYEIRMRDADLFGIWRDKEKEGAAMPRSEDLRYGGYHSGTSAAVSERRELPFYFYEWLTLNIRYKKPAASVASELFYPLGIESYSLTPSDDWRFAAAVAEFGLLASGSDHRGDSSLEHVSATLRGMDLADDYKWEFYEIVRSVR